MAWWWWLALKMAFFATFIGTTKAVSWEEWWTYDGISGPSFWGLINPDWSLCTEGRLQSPINVDPKTVLYDPFLKSIKINDNKVDGLVHNTGHGILFRPSQDGRNKVNISNGPTVYNYPVFSISIKFGQREEDGGSEHSVADRKFVGEVQLLGYNADLYDNETIALKYPKGIAAVSVMLQVGDLSNVELRRLTKAAMNVRYGGQTFAIEGLSPFKLLPETAGYITYEGSMTEPGCQETVTWILMNRPIFVSPQQMQILRKLVQGEISDPRAPLGGNFRPVQPINGRRISTNVLFSNGQKDSKCPTLQTNLEYHANVFHLPP